MMYQGERNPDDILGIGKKVGRRCLSPHPENKEECKRLPHSEETKHWAIYAGRGIRW